MPQDYRRTAEADRHLSTTARAIDAHARALRTGEILDAHARALRQGAGLGNAARSADREQLDGANDMLAVEVAETEADRLVARVAVLETTLGEAVSMIGQMASAMQTAIETFAPILVEIITRQNDILTALAKQSDGGEPNPTAH